MGSFTFTASESLLPSRALGDVVTIEIGVQEDSRERKVEKNAQRSLGGAMEVLKHRADVTYQITFEPVCGQRLLQLREFLDSTEGGEEFTMDLYGNSAAQIAVKRIDEGYEEQSFIRRGAAELDMVVATIEVLLL